MRKCMLDNGKEDEWIWKNGDTKTHTDVCNKWWYISVISGDICHVWEGWEFNLTLVYICKEYLEVIR